MKELHNEWVIYSNPTDSKLYIEYNSDKEIKAEVEIYNLVGSKMLKNSVVLGKAMLSAIDVSVLQDGVYIMSIKNTEGRTIKTQKVMINSSK